MRLEAQGGPLVEGVGEEEDVGGGEDGADGASVDLFFIVGSPRL